MGNRFISPIADRLTSFAGLLLVASIVFYPAMSGTLIWDDHNLPLANPNAATQPPAFWIGGVRPLLMATYWLNFHFFGTGTFSYHALNVCLHAVVATLVWICAERMIELAGINPDKRKSLAAVVACLFLVHPLQTESVDSIAGRSEVLTGAFVFGAFAVFLRRSRPGTLLWRGLAVIALVVAAFLSKEHGVVVVGLFVLTDVFWNEGSISGRVRKNRILYLLLLPVAATGVALGLRVLLAARSAGFQVAGATWLDYLFTQWRVIPQYLRLFVLPFRQSADWMFPRSHRLTDHRAFIYGLFLLASVFVAVRFRRRAPLAAYGYLVFLLLLLPTSSVFPIQDAMAERRMYLPIFGLCLMAASLIDMSGLDRWLLKFFPVIILLVGGVLSWNRSWVWRSPLTFWSDVVKSSPHNLRGHINFANAMLERGLCAEAAREFEGVRLSQPLLSNTKVDLAQAAAYGCLNDLVKQQRVLLSLAQREPSATSYSELGLSFAKAGDGPKAMFYFSEAIRLDTAFARAWALRGLLSVAMKTGSAADDFRQALKLDPNNNVAKTGLAQLGDR